MSDLNDYPIIRLPGSDRRWESGHDWGEELEKRWPNAGGWDFAQACSYNPWTPGEDGPDLSVGITDLKLLREGENDGRSWIWLVKVASAHDPTERYSDREWVLVGGCDYTGWDCRSGITWVDAA